MPRLAARTQDFLTFQVVELFKQAQALQAAGHDIISLGIGEPDFTAPPQVVEALERAARAGLSGYGPPAGLMPLREAIAQFYHDKFGAKINPARVIVTAGASGALTLACAALVNHGGEVLMPDPSYPANSNFVLAAGGVPRLIPSSAAKRFQLSADDVARHWTPATQGVLVASPSNPTGTSIAHEELAQLLAQVRARDGFAIVDEIYLGLSYENAPRSALTLDDDIIVINSFSKFFHMTGWRLGWMIVPEDMVAPVEKIAASLAICAPTLAQHAALACFTEQAMKTFEHRREAFKQRRDYLLPEFERLGIHVPVKPDGAFYIYADISNLGMDSATFSQQLLLQAGVAAVPGLDFGPAHGKHTMRFSYATGLDRLEEAVARIGKLLQR
ncbi:pyridoxal phosphate-dependent aminotransferase [Achromobacter sp. LC458]|uniref:Pyridoxal phosphate-dependent aminotransferase n=1 Tax=Achromobacter spanius TaxID=217203 RepID=A0A2S5GJH5_9BURK|nr:MULTISPECIES: pyridoxal phosphate-dependent aminotransferase [Achromobacter]MDX3987334.1 pyridoxal phosphate-dependent aminotransferase [Achromobacter sp.]PPA73064.1 pyridoxal phosphate-dependent aminotransferase [Achromobacter spanius]QYJ20485.1 pyridoxal phosphate-dependent aminotransferase [Achromobacter sp. ES-001]TRM52751.1 pyridoxal phosphate-dependent aminotransferase [Achromobacter sp. LC458]HCQ49821.1 pyridoxal phosphate-dependent aminotransferase [Achromobacter sp.]